MYRRLGRCCWLLTPRVSGWYNLAVTQIRMELWTDAISGFRQAINLDPEFFDAYLNLGNIYAQRGSWKEASKSYASALKLDDSDWHLYHNYAVCEEHTGNIAHAVALYQRALDLNPQLDQSLLRNAQLKLRRLQRNDNASLP